MNWNRLREVLADFEKTTLVYHRDADGVCSAAILDEVLDTSSVLPNDDPGIGISNELLDIINGSDYVVFTDLAVDSLSIFDKIKSENIFVLDHHPLERDLNNDNVTHVNPRFENPEAYIPASYLSFKLIGEMSSVSWKAGVGVIGDHGVEDCKDLFDKIDEEDSKILPDDKYSYKKLIDSKLGIISKMIDASKSIRGIKGIKEAYEVIRESENPEEVFHSSLPKYHDKFEKILERDMRNFKDNSKFYPKTDAFLYELQTSKSISSSLSTRLAQENPDSVVIVYQKTKNGMKLSGRCQSGRLDVSEIITGSIKEGEGDGGGHPQAAGGFVKKGKENVVLQRIQEKLEGIS